MHTAVCLLCAGQPKCTSDSAKSEEFLGEFSWVEFDPMGVRGLLYILSKLLLFLLFKLSLLDNEAKVNFDPLFIYFATVSCILYL